MPINLSLLGSLMACQPVSSLPENVNCASALLTAHLQQAGLHCTVEDIDGRQVLFAATGPGKSPDVLLNAHLDVVPASDELFTLRVEGNIAHGRGTCDCLGNVICAAQVLINLKDQASVGAIFTCDEEIGGATTAAMVARGYRANRFAIVIDGSRHAVAIAQKGIIILRLLAEGRGGHASTPWRCDNPIDKLIEGYARLKAAWPAVTEDDQWQDTMTPCMIKAGSADNQIPDQAEMTLNIRYTDADQFDAIVEKVRQLTGLKIEECRTCKPMFTDENAPAIQALLAALRQTFPGETISVTRMNGATDARHLSNMGVPVAIIGTPGGNPHNDQEWADIEGIAKYTEMLTDFIKHF